MQRGSCVLSNISYHMGRGWSRIWDHQSDCRRPNYNCMTYIISNRILKRIGNSENLSRSLFLAVPIDFAAILSFCKPGYVVVHMDWGVRNSSSGYKNAIMTFFTKYSTAPCDRKCRSEHQTLFLFFGEGLGTKLSSHVAWEWGWALHYFPFAFSCENICTLMQYHLGNIHCACYTLKCCYTLL